MFLVVILEAREQEVENRVYQCKTKEQAFERIENEFNKSLITADIEKPPVDYENSWEVEEAYEAGEISKEKYEELSAIFEDWENYVEVGEGGFTIDTMDYKVKGEIVEREPDQELLTILELNID